MKTTMGSAGKKPAAKKAGKKTGIKKAATKKSAKKTPRRRKPGPALEVDPAVLEFIDALDRFKKTHGKPFPSWSEVLHVLKSLGYRKA